MKCKLFPFQEIAVNNLIAKASEAIGAYERTRTPQVVSLQAPTGAGKTIIMTTFIEAIFFGRDKFVPQPDAVFVWLSDSPELNEQSKQKIELKSDKIKLGQCVVIREDSFDKRVLDDGEVYFLNTQKIGKNANFCKHSDGRQYTIWETMENTLMEKADRLYFLIDEAHRGMHGNDAGRATSIMQRFLKGSPQHNLSPMPVVIGMSATSERFNNLVKDTSSTLQKEIVTPSMVRSSGLLKNRILILHPEDTNKYNDMAVLDKAADEWIDKRNHWHQYCVEQHYAHVHPVFVVQVEAGSGENISNTDLLEVVTRIENRFGRKFVVGEVVHTFGSNGDLDLGGLKVLHVEASDITDDKKIKVVLFKENLSTGWDCPRAETMMSFRHAQDITYIAQLLGRMVRTPLQCHIMADDTLNDVKLYLPYFNAENVKNVVKELQSSEVEEIPAFIDTESVDTPEYVPWTVRTVKRSIQHQGNDMQPSLFFNNDGFGNESSTEVVGYNVTVEKHTVAESHKTFPIQNTGVSNFETGFKDVKPQETPTPIVPIDNNSAETGPETIKPVAKPLQLFPIINREAVTKFINESALLTYNIRSVSISSYLKSLFALSNILTDHMIYFEARREVEKEIIDIVHNYIVELKNTGKYDKLRDDVLDMKLAVHIFDMFGDKVNSFKINSLFAASDDNLDPQLRYADAKLSYYGFAEKYAQYYYDNSFPNSYKIDCILFATNSECLEKLNAYAKKKFCYFKDTYRVYMVNKSDKCKKLYDDVVSDADAVSDHNFSLPERIDVKVDPDGIDYYNHLFADDNGISKFKLNTWEAGVLEEESKRVDFVCWLRNPSRAAWSLCIPYELNGEIKPCYPDFVIVRNDNFLKYIIDILEPHGANFKDNLAKAKGFVRYIAKQNSIGRIQMIRKINKKFVRLELSNSVVGEKVLKAVTIEEFDNIFENYGFSDSLE